MLLIVGATGELGFKIAREARAAGVPVRALARSTTNVDDLIRLGVEVRRGDLTEPGTLDGVCDDVSTVVATANTIVPRRGERISAAGLNAGYLALAEQASRAAVGRFIFVSVPRELIGLGAPEFDTKAVVEEYLRARPFELCIVRPSLFMESWLPAIGSRLAVTGAERSTLDRGFWLSRLARTILHRTADRFGIAQHPGLRSGTRHSFVTVRDVAEAVMRLVLTEDPVPGEVALGGPDALAWSEVVRAHEMALARRWRTLRIPGTPLRLISALLRPFSPTAANLLQVNALVGRRSTATDCSTLQQLLGHPATPVSDHLTTAAAAARRQRVP